MSEVKVHCFDIKGPDVAQLFAAFGRRPLPDALIWSLSLAESCMPENSVGFRVWITKVAGVDVHRDHLLKWAKELSEALGEIKPRTKLYRRKLFADYSATWGHQAATDGINLALFGTYPPTSVQAAEYGCDPTTYKRMRNLIAGFAAMQAAQYEDALNWAVRQNTRIDLT